MNTNLQLAVTDTLEFLLTLQRESIQPAGARERLQSLRLLHPGLALHLLSEVEAYDQSVHYDVLIRNGDDGTVSLSYCPERATPWPLRGVHRWSDADLLRVNAYVLKVDEAIAFLDFVWDAAPITAQLVNQCVIREELERDPIVLTDAELQEAVDQFRAGKKLFKSEDMLRWLESSGMTQESLERYVSDNRLIDKLRDRVAADRVDAYFRQHVCDFDRVGVARIELVDEDQARNLADQIRDGKQDFFTVAEQCFQEAADAGAKQPRELFAVIERRQVATTVGNQLFSALPGQLVGPFPSERGYSLFRVVSSKSACLDERTVTTIKNILFEEWLAERRQAAQVEWCWGNARKTG